MTGHTSHRAVPYTVHGADERGLTMITPPGPCQYVPDQVWQLRYEFAPDLTAERFMIRLNAGWRRFGPVMFRPECPTCRRCQPLRIPVATFAPNESQRRAWKRNAADVEIRVGAPALNDEKLALYHRFHPHQHEAKAWPYDPDQLPLLFAGDPYPTEEWAYYLGDRLLGVGYVDVLPEALSAIYFYWDPDERKRSLGTFNILRLIATARERRLPYVHLGYYVEGCGSLEYKAKFGPNEVLADVDRWTPLTR